MNPRSPQQKTLWRIPGLLIGDFLAFRKLGQAKYFLSLPLTSDTPFRTLVSGTELEILERNRFYAKVRTNTGEEGWVKAGYLVSAKPAAARAMELEASNADITARLEKVLAQTSDVRQTIADLESELVKVKEEGAIAALGPGDRGGAQPIHPADLSRRGHAAIGRIFRRTDRPDIPRYVRRAVDVGRS